MSLDEHCPGCGGGEGNQSCKIKKINDGRKKTFFCVAAKLLELDDLKLVIWQIELDEELNGLPIKEKVAYMKNSWKI